MRRIETLSIALVWALAAVPAGALAQDADAVPNAGDVAATATAVAPSSAETTRVAQGDEIIVTAQKRAENIQDVPISIQAFSGSQLEKSGVSDVLQLTKVTPSFTTTRQSSPSSIRMNIRGVGATTQSAVEPSVATFVDDIYVSRPGALVAAFYDVEAVEVLRGPQGTLFGRNASVGAVSIHNRKPSDDLSMDVSAQAASYNSYELTGALNVPFGGDNAVRIAGIASTTDGPWHTRVGDHDYGGMDTLGARITVKLAPASNVSWLLRADYLKLSGDANSHNTVVTDTVTPAARENYSDALGGVVPDFDHQFSRTTNNFMVGDLDDHQYGLSSDLSVETSGGYTFRLINAMRDWSSEHYVGDLIFSPRPMLIRNELQASNSQSHELQFISPSDTLLDGRLSFVSGLYYFREKLDINERFDFTEDSCNYLIAAAKPSLVETCLEGPFVGASQGRFHQVTESYAVYGQATYELLDDLDLILGGRYTKDKKHGSFDQAVDNPGIAVFRTPESTPLKFSDGRFTWRANLSYHPSRDLMLFANYSTGFKSGGFNSGGGSSALGDRRVFNSETVSDYEAGLKSTLADGVTFNLTGFRMEVKGYQDRSNDGSSFLVRNAANLRQQGFEAEAIIRPVRNVRINGAVSYLDSEFLSYPGAAGLPGFGGVQDLAGQRNNFAPKWQGAAGAQFDGDLGFADLNFSLRGDVTYTSASNIGSVTNGNPQSIQPAYALVGTSLTLSTSDDKYSMQFFASNLLDQGYCTYIFPNTLDGPLGLRDKTTGSTLMRCTVGMPRQIGVRLTGHF